MADTIQTSDVLYLNQQFADGDTRLLNLPNPVNGLSSSDIKSLENYMIANQPTIGDRTGAAFTGFKSAYSKKSTKYILDLS